MAEHLIAKIVNDKRDYQPGEEIALGISWDFPETEPHHIEVRFVWNTFGKGDQDIQIEKTIDISHPGFTGQELVKTNLPFLPYTYRGKLVSIVWAVEVIAFPMQESQRLVINISPAALASSSDS